MSHVRQPRIHVIKIQYKKTQLWFYSKRKLLETRRRKRSKILTNGFFVSREEPALDSCDFGGIWSSRGS